MCKKKNGLAINGKNLVKIYLIENNIVSKFCREKGLRKKRGEKSGVYFINLLKTHIEKMSTLCLSTMLMKTMQLN